MKDFLLLKFKYFQRTLKRSVYMYSVNGKLQLVSFVLHIFRLIPRILTLSNNAQSNLFNS